MADPDEAERIALAQALMADITARLEDLADLATQQQLARKSDPALLRGIEAVTDLIRAHSRLVPTNPTRAKPRT